MTTYNYNSDNNELDSTISNLKSRLFDLEQQEKDHNALKQKLSQLKNHFQSLSSTKNKLEQELKQKDESYNQRICNLRSDNENLQLNYNEKLSLNKKLFNENDSLEKEIVKRDNEINELKERLNNLKNQFGQSLADKGDLENQVQKLKNIKQSQLNDINKLTKENQNLSMIVNDQDNKLRNFQDEIAMMDNQSQENDATINNLNIKLRSLMDDITNTQNVVKKNNFDNQDIDEKLKVYNTQCEALQYENNDINNKILKQRAIREEKQRQNESLNQIVNEHEMHLNDLSNKYNTLNSMYIQSTNDNKNIQVDNGKLKEHIMLLTQQNQKLLEELENCKTQDIKIKSLLNRKDQSLMLLNSVHGCIEQAAICLENIENDPIGFRKNATFNFKNKNSLINSTESQEQQKRNTSPIQKYNYVNKKEN